MLLSLPTIPTLNERRVGTCYTMDLLASREGIVNRRCRPRWPSPIDALSRFVNERQNT